MDANHEIIIPNKGLPFKMFIFEGKNGNYVRNKHWHTSIEIFAVFSYHSSPSSGENTMVPSLASWFSLATRSAKDIV